MISIAESDPPAGGVSLARNLVIGVPRAYAVLFFSANERFGWWLLGISLLAPDLGLSGLAGVCAAGTLAWLLGYDRASIRNGFLLFNPLLVCLTVGFLHRCYHFDPHIHLVLWSMACIGSFFLSAAMQQWVGAHFGLSAHSMPAVITSYVLYFLGFSLCGPATLPVTAPNAWLDLPGLPSFLQTIFQAFGAMLFQPRALPGVLVFIGLAVTSPLSALMASLAIFAGVETMSQLGFPMGPESVIWCGFNFLLCGIALGAGYYVTSGASLLLALAGASVCALVSLALATALRYFSLPASALPYNLVVITLVYALRQRRTPGALYPSPSPGSLPETAARQVRMNARRFPDLNTPALSVPFDSRRTITQGFTGTLTHRGQWQYALDFETERHTVKDFESASADRAKSVTLEDFPTYDTPVLSPCSGVVAYVVNHVPDNEPGGNNPEENWGNYVLIHSDARYYVLLAHLKQGSSTVFIGQYVYRGTILGRCGNSGRSPVPHLHMHIQDTGFLGAPTRPFCRKNYIETSADGTSSVFHTSGLPVENAQIRPATPLPALSESLYSWLPGEYRYKITAEKGRSWEETLRLDFDENGRYRLRSHRSHARLSAFLSEGIFYAVDYQGDDRSLLALIATGVARVPCIADPGVTWSDSTSAVPYFRYPERWVGDLIEPFFGPFLMRLTYRVEADGNGFVVRANFKKTPGSTSPAGSPREIACHLGGRRAVVRVEARFHDDRTLSAELIDYQPLS